MRTINPTPRFVTINSNDAASAGNLVRNGVHVFDSDSIIHSISIVEFGRLSGAIPCSYACAVGLNLPVSIGFQPNWQGILYSNNPTNVSATEVTINNGLIIPFDRVVMTSGTSIGAYLGGGAGVNFCSLTVSICFNALSEWANFREPRVAVRI